MKLSSAKRVPINPVTLVLARQLHLSPVSIAPHFAGEHQERLEPLLSVDDVVHDPAAFLTAVHENRWQGPAPHHAVDQFRSIALGPDGIPLKPWLEIQLVVFPQIDNVGDGLGYGLISQLGHKFLVVSQVRTECPGAKDGRDVLPSLRVEH